MERGALKPTAQQFFPLADVVRFFFAFFSHSFVSVVAVAGFCSRFGAGTGVQSERSWRCGREAGDCGQNRRRGCWRGVVSERGLYIQYVWCEVREGVAVRVGM